MSRLPELLPLILLTTILLFFAWLGYQIHLYTSRLAARTASTLQSHNIALGPDGKGLRVGVREVAHETYAAKVQQGLVGAWNAAELQPRAVPVAAPDGRRSLWSSRKRTAAAAPSSGAAGGTGGGVGEVEQGVRTTGTIGTAASARQARPQGPRAQGSAGASAGAAAAARGAASR